MRFSIAPQIFEQFPTYCVGGVVAAHVNNHSLTAVEQIYTDLLQEASTLRRHFSTGESAPGGSNPLTGQPAIAQWREAFKAAGIRASEYLSSVEALARRAIKGDTLPQVNPAVDLANTFSLKYMLPLGGHDLDALVGDFGVRLAAAGDFFSPPDGSEAQVESVPPGEPVYADDAEVRTRRWVWRQGRKARVTEASRNIFFPIDGWVGLTDGEVREASRQLASRLTDLLGAECQEFFLDKNSPTFEWEIAARKTGDNPSVITAHRPPGDEIDDLLTRGVSDIVGREELEAKLRSGKQLRIKFGIDPTGPQIHIGRSVPLLKLRDFQRLGHKIVLICGAFTGQIGDASDKNSTRPILTPAQVEQNMADYKRQIGLILDLDQVEWHYNTEWFNEMPFKEGIVLMSHFTVAQMIERDNFSQRFQAGKPISLQEIVYPVLQGYDSVMIKSDVEIGGTDQLFNMMAGRTLQRIYDQPQQAIVMNGMINAPDGQKMSTSLGNGVYITESAKDQYAKMLKTLDEMIVQYFEVLTRVPMSEIDEMRAAIGRGDNPVNFKKRLAATLVEMYHGPEAAQEVAAAFEREIVHKEVPQDIPVYELAAGEMALRDLLVETGLAGSKKEADRFVEQNGITVDGERPTDPKARLALHDGMLLKRGNRHYARIKLK